MIGLRRHPSWGELNRLVDGELDPQSCVGVREHLAGCDRCARELDFLDQVRQVGRDLPHPIPPKTLLEDIRRDRAEGERVILPAAPVAPRKRRRLVLPAAAAALVLAGVGLLATAIMAPEAGAGASELSFYPPHPVPGETVRITYRPSTELAGEPELRVRFRLRTPDSEPPRATLGAHAEALIQPDGDGRYSGKFTLPEDFAFGVSSVESLDGERLDDYGGRLWSLRAHTEAGLPRLGALRQEYRVLENRRWPEARSALLEMAAIYDNPEAWSLLLSHEQPIRTPDLELATFAEHRKLFRRFDMEAAYADESDHYIASMVRYASFLENEQAYERWLDRLRERNPADRLVVAAGAISRSSDRDVMSYLDSLWSVGGRTAQVYREGLILALKDGDPASVERWAARGISFHEDHALVSEVAFEMLAHDALRERGVSEILGLLDHLASPDDEERPLNRRRSDLRRDNREMQAGLLVKLARQLVLAGDPEGALRHLEAADSLGLWLPELYRVRLGALSSAGHGAAALDDLLRLAVDPVSEDGEIAELSARLGVEMSELDAGRLAEAEAEMIERVVDSQDLRRRLPDATVTDASGSQRSLRRLIGHRPAVLLLWDRRVSESIERVAEVIRGRQLQDGKDWRFLWVTSEANSESLRRFIGETGLGIEPYHDSDLEVAGGLGEWGSSAFYVIDGTGVVLVRTDSLMEAVRHLEVLESGLHDTA